MIKVNFFLNALGIGGTEKTALLLAGFLGPEFLVEIFSYKDADMARKEQFEAVAKVTLLDRNAPNISLLENCDIFHAFRSGYAEFPEPARDMTVPRFVETNIFGHLDPNPAVTKTLFMSKWLLLEALNRSPNSEPSLDSGIPPRFDYLNNPILPPQTGEKLDLGLSSDTIVVGRCGRPDNGIYDPINVRAVRQAISAGFNIHFLVMAPPNNMLLDMDRFAIPYTVIEPTISEEVLGRFYNTIDIYCHARLDGETFGCNIAEAMMHSKPVITHVAKAVSPGMGVFQAQTTLVENNVNGFVVPNDPSVYGNKLIQLCADTELRNKMGQKSWTLAMSNFHVSLVVNKLTRIYKELING